MARALGRQRSIDVFDCFFPQITRFHCSWSDPFSVPPSVRGSWFLLRARERDGQRQGRVAVPPEGAGAVTDPGPIRTEGPEVSMFLTASFRRLRDSIAHGLTRFPFRFRKGLLVSTRRARERDGQRQGRVAVPPEGAGAVTDPGPISDRGTRMPAPFCSTLAFSSPTRLTVVADGGCPCPALAALAL
jgi:hypothetical protein